MKKLIANFAANLANRLLALMRNGVSSKFTREEFRFMNVSFSQFGEDLAIGRWVERLTPQSHVYVDVGCFHPIHCSNTLLLNKQGWKGVNVDADSEKIDRFQVARPSDYNVVAAVSANEEDKIFLRYEGTGTNRLSSHGEADLRSAIGEPPLESVAVRTRTLDSILESAPWPITQIGYLNVDCEGHDLQVLQGFNLEKYRPVIITIEALTPEDNQSISQFLLARGYEHKESIYKTLVFVRP